MMTQQTHYQHSGNAPVGGMLLTLIFGALAAVILGAIYGLLIYWIPFVYINALVTFGFGIVLGAAIGSLGKLGKLRNNNVITIIALLISVLAYYTHWVVWMKGFSGGYVLEPGILWQLILLIADQGAWSIFDWTPTGWAIWTIWGIEAVMIVGIGSFAAGTIIDVPFCETTNQWCTETSLPQQFSPLDLDRNLGTPQSVLEALQPLAENGHSYTQVTVAQAEGSELRCVSVQAVEVEIKDDKEESTSTEIVRNMLFDRHSFDKLMALSDA